MKRRVFLASTGSVAFGGCLNSLNPSSTDGEAGRTDSVWIENHHNTSHQVQITVTSKDGNSVLNRTYELPRNTGTEIPNIGSLGETYTVVATLDGSQQIASEWAVSSCKRSSQKTVPPIEDTAVGAVIADDRFFITSNHCDKVTAGHGRDIEYRNHTNLELADLGK